MMIVMSFCPKKSMKMSLQVEVQVSHNNFNHLFNFLFFSDEDRLKKHNEHNKYEADFTTDFEEEDLFEKKVKEQLESEYQSKKKDFTQSKIISKQSTKVTNFLMETFSRFFFF